MRKRRFRTSLAATTVLLGLVIGRESREAELPPDRQAIFLARVIAYDENLKTRAGSAVNIGILAKNGDRESEGMQDAVAKAFAQLESAPLRGLPVKISRIPFSDRDALDRAVQAAGIDTLYVCSGLDANLADIKGVARARKVLAIASKENQVKAGLSLGVFVVEGKNTILVNLEASRDQGVAFGLGLLQLATVVK
jgi:hypothetical protein